MEYTSGASTRATFKQIPQSLLQSCDHLYHSIEHFSLIIGSLAVLCRVQMHECWSQCKNDNKVSSQSQKLYGGMLWSSIITRPLLICCYFLFIRGNPATPGLSLSWMITVECDYYKLYFPLLKYVVCYLKSQVYIYT